jgi:hypothetical protein
VLSLIPKEVTTLQQISLTHEQIIAFLNFIEEYQKKKKDVVTSDNPTFLMFEAYRVLNMKFDTFINTVSVLATIGILILIKATDGRTVSISLSDPAIWKLRVS